MKETIPSSSITWSEMGKQNVQAEKVYSDWFIALFAPVLIRWSNYFGTGFCHSRLKTDLTITKAKNGIHPETQLLHIRKFWLLIFRQTVKKIRD